MLLLDLTTRPLQGLRNGCLVHFERSFGPLWASRGDMATFRFAKTSNWAPVNSKRWQSTWKVLSCYAQNGRRRRSLEREGAPWVGSGSPCEPQDPSLCIASRGQIDRIAWRPRTARTGVGGGPGRDFFRRGVATAPTRALISRVNSLLRRFRWRFWRISASTRACPGGTADSPLTSGL